MKNEGKILGFMKRENWIKGDWAEDKDGNSVNACSRKAVRWCLSGYVRKLYRGDRREVVRDKLIAVIGKSMGLIFFNDAHDTTFRDVKRVVKKAGV